MITLKEPEVIEQGREALLSCLRRVPFVRAEALEPDPPEVDVCIRVEVAGRTTLVVAEAKASGQPRLAREAIHQLSNVLQSYHKHPAYGVFIAPYVTEQTAKLCQQHGVGFVDLSGNCRLCFANVYIEFTGQPNRFARKRDLRTLYSPKAARLLRVLLSHPRRTWRLHELAREANVSLGQTANVKKKLSDREWITAGTDGFRLTAPAELLTEWTHNPISWRDESRHFYSLQAPAEVERALATACQGRQIRYALTCVSASLRYAPMLRAQRMSAYVDADPDQLAGTLGLRDVPSGANVTLVRPGDEGVYYGAKPIDGIATVSPVQAYLDLRRMPGRGEEAAEAIMEKVLRPSW